MRYRSLAWSRQRWWFELARLALLVGTIAQCCFMSIAFLELRPNLGWFASRCLCGDWHLPAQPSLWLRALAHGVIATESAPAGWPEL